MVSFTFLMENRHLRFKVNQFYFMSTVNFSKRFYASEPAQSPADGASQSVAVANRERTNLEQLKVSMPENTRFVYPEFLPDPNMKFRHPIKEKIERQDMLNHRYVAAFSFFGVK